MRAEWNGAGVRTSLCAVRCCVLLWSCAFAAPVFADDSGEDFDEPLCRRSHAVASVSGWQLKTNASVLAKAVRDLGLPAYMPRNTLQHEQLFSWSSAQEFGFDSDLNEWHRLRVYGSRDAVRVVTLWNSNSVTFALQADKHGDPMLRWTSRELSRGEASRGLLDGWLSPRETD